MRYWTQEIALLVALFLIGCVIGLLADHPVTGMVLGLALYISYSFWQMWRILRWSHKAYDTLPPSAPGVWGNIFDHLYRYQRRERRRQTQLRQVIGRFDRLSEAMKDGMIVLDNKGALDTWNAAASTMLGLEYPADRGQYVTNLLRHPQFIRYFESGKYEEGLTTRSPLDESRWLHFQIVSDSRNERLMVVRDITRLQRLQEMRRDFVANVSHELRTPLTVFTGYLEPLSDYAGELLPPRMQRGLEQMQQQSDRMRHLIDDLLMLSRLENGIPISPYNPVNIATLIHQAEQDGNALSQGLHSISTDITPGYHLLGAEEELRSAVTNLVSNAVRYSGEKTHIRITWRVDENSTGQLCVSDDGEGIEKHHLDRLTERFYRVDKGRSSSTGGTGLGLAIVKHVMIHHEGQVRIASQPGDGARFTLVFPASRVVQD